MHTYVYTNTYIHTCTIHVNIHALEQTYIHAPHTNMHIHTHTHTHTNTHTSTHTICTWDKQSSRPFVRSFIVSLHHLHRVRTVTYIDICTNCSVSIYHSSEIIQLKILRVCMALNHKIFSHEHLYHTIQFMKWMFLSYVRVMSLYRHILQNLLSYNCNTYLPITSSITVHDSYLLLQL